LLYRLLFFDPEYRDTETENTEAMKSEDKLSLKNLLSAPEQQPQLQELQISEHLLDLRTDTTQIQSATAAATGEKCMSRILIIILTHFRLFNLY
jgi:hypothetical protein